MKKNRKKHSFFDFIRKMRYKYRLSLINEEKLEEVWFARLSRFSVLLFFTSFLLFSFVVVTLFVVFSPLRHYFPGYQDSGNRVALVQQSLEVDSLSKRIETQQSYLVLLKELIKGNQLTDTVLIIDTTQTIKRPIDLIEKSKKEINFVEEYEDTEKYNLASIPNDPSENILIFFKPIDGVVASTFQPRENKFGVSLITAPNETVKSVLEGKIIFAEYTFLNGWVIQVQHNNNYISIYKNNIRLLKEVGDKVNAGESLAIAGEENTKLGKHFYFELWKKGNPINPQEVITF